MLFSSFQTVSFHVRRVLGKRQFVLCPGNQAITVMMEDRTNWAPATGPHGLGLLRLRHFDYNWGRSITSRGSNPLSLSLSCVSSASGSLRDMVWADCACPEACVLIISDNSSSESPGTEPTAACLLSQGVLAISPAALHWSADRQPSTPPPSPSQGGRGKSEPAQAGLIRPWRTMLQVPGLAEVEMINHLKIIAPLYAISWTLRKWNMEGGPCPGWRPQVLWQL